MRSEQFWRGGVKGRCGLMGVVPCGARSGAVRGPAVPGPGVFVLWGSAPSDWWLPGVGWPLPTAGTRRKRQVGRAGLGCVGAAGFDTW